MTHETMTRWTCNPCGATSTQARPKGWTWLRSGSELHHRCPQCEAKAPEHQGVPLGKTS